MTDDIYGKAIDGIEVGGRNYFQIQDIGAYRGGRVYENDITFTQEGYKLSTDGAPRDLIGVKARNLTEGIINISYKSNILSRSRVFYAFWNDDGEVQGQLYKTVMPDANGFFDFNLQVPKDADRLEIGLGTYPFTEDYTLENIKIEKGNKATDWTPAPEDITGNIDMNDYTTNREQLNNIIDLAIRDIVSVVDDEPPEIAEGFYANYKKIIDVIPTDTDIIERELADYKRKARIELNSFSNSNYHETEKQLLATYVQDGLQAVESALDKQQTDVAVSQTIDLIESLPQKKYKDKEMFLNTSTHEMIDIQGGADPDLYDGESDYRLIQLYHNQFSGLTFPGTNRPQPSLKLFTMSKEEVE